MPGSYPPAPPTLAGDILSIHRLLQSPAQIRRRLRTIRDLRFVSDKILTQRFRSQGGAVLYEMTEPIRNARDAGSIAPGSEYPRDVPGVGTAGLAAVQKWGQKVFLADEKIKRSVYAGDEVDRALRKVLATVVAQVDEVTLSVIASQVTATSSAIAPWDSTDAEIFRDLALAEAKILDLRQGYQPDTVLMSDTKYALAISDKKIALLRRRETTDNPIYGGELEMIGKYKVVTAPVSSLPSDDVWLFDSRQLGGMADETEVDPGYSVAELGVQVQTQRVADRDGWDLWGRRLTVPVVQEPGAAIRITFTEGS
jgi:hypothetical protein